MKEAIRSFFAFVVYSLISKGISVPEPISWMVSNVLRAIYLRDLLKRLRINCVLDIGAHHGSYVKTLRRLGFTGHILSFEPNPHSFKLLSGLYSSDPLWKGRNIALGSRNTKMPFNLTELSDMSSLLTPKTANVSAIEDVEIKRLDAIADEMFTTIENPRVFLKVDTQGYDLEVIKGATGCIDIIQGFQSEISVVPLYEDMPHYLDSLRFYESMGFSLMNLFTVSRSPKKANVVEYDCLMARL